MITQSKIDDFVHNPELGRQFIMAVKDDYELFAKEFMGHIVKEVPPFHHEMYQIMNRGYKHSAFVVFRGGAKCLHELTPVMMDNYEHTYIKDIRIGDVVKSFRDGKICNAVVSNKEYVGLKQGYTLKLKHGQSVIASAEHKFLTLDGWKELQDLTVDDYVAVPSNFLSWRSDNASDMSNEEVRFIAYMLMEGAVTHTNCYFTNETPSIMNDFKYCCNKLGFKYKDTNEIRVDLRSGNSSPRTFLRSYGILGCHSRDKFIPSDVFESSYNQRLMFIASCMVTDGTFCKSGSAITLASERLVRDLRSLLLSVGIIAYSRNYEINGVRYYRLTIDAHGVAKIYNSGYLIHKIESAHVLRDAHKFTTRTSLPVSFLKRHGITNKDLIKAGGHAYYRNNVPREVLFKLDISKLSDVIEYVGHDICFSRVRSIEKDIEVPMYDIEVAGTRNFVANFIVTHNSTLSKTIQTTSDVVFRKQPFTILLSESVNQAVADIVSIEDELENNEGLNAFFGNMIGTTWNKQEFEASNGVYVVAKSYGARIRGLKWKNMRITKCILDDYESEDNTSTQRQRDDVFNWIETTVLPSGDPCVQFQFFGTIVHPDSHLAKLKTFSQFQPPRGHYFEIPIEKNGVSAWPSRFPMSYINELRNDAIEKKKFAQFLQEYYHIPYLVGKCVFNVDKITEVDARLEHYEDITYVVLNGQSILCNVFQAIDPASSTDEKADRTVHATIAMLPNKDIIIFDVDAQRIYPFEQSTLILNKADQFKPKLITIETQGYQKALYDIVTTRMMAESRYYSLKEFKSSTSKNNKFLLGLEPEINQGKVMRVKGMKCWELLEKELRAFNENRREHDDTVDAIFLAIINAYPPHSESVDELIALRKKTNNNFKTDRRSSWLTS